MTRIWRNGAVTGTTLFLEACAFYLLFGVVSQSLQTPDAFLPLWLVLLALVWAFFLSMYIETLRFTADLRGLFGMGISMISVLLLVGLNTGGGLASLEAIIDGDMGQAFTIALSSGFMVALWWRSAKIAHDKASLDTVRGSFKCGTVMFLAGLVFDAISPYSIVNGFLLLAFFTAGLSGLALARFSSETGESQTMSLDWWLPIAASVTAVLLLGLLAAALGLGGLDEVTRSTLGMIGFVGFWVAKPLLLALGLITALLVVFANWISAMFGGGDLSGLERASGQIELFQESMRREAGEDGLPTLLVNLLKASGFLVGATVAGWVLYRVFQIRRGGSPPLDVEETRESIFSWCKANKDLSDFLSGWWSNLSNLGGRAGRGPQDPVTPREFYHGLLSMAQDIDHPRRQWQTPKEHQWDLKGLMPDRAVNGIVDGFQSAYYGHWEADPEDVAELRRDWKEIKDFLAHREHPGSTEAEETREAGV